MAKLLHNVLALSITLAAATPAALAQEGEEEDDAGDLFDETATTGEMGTPTGAEENPDDPDALSADAATMSEPEEKTEDEAAAPGTQVYPQRRIDRPITLYKNMAEARLDVPFVIGTDSGSARTSPLLGVALALSGRFGVTDDIEIGLRYGAVAFHESIAMGPVDSNVTAGRAVQLDFVYQIFHWLGAQVSVPFYLDPYAMGLTFGAPMQAELGPLQFFGGHDLVQINVVKFFPEWSSPVVNDLQVEADEINQVISDGRVNILFGVRYQVNDEVAISAESGITFEDFENSDNAVPFRVGPIYSPSNMLDFGLETGFLRLDESDSFFVQAMAALRI